MAQLLPCPKCSYPAETRSGWVHVGPVWAVAPRSTKRRGVKCAILTGCPHVTAWGKFAVVEASAAAEVVQGWNAEAERLIELTLIHMSGEQRAARRAGLGFPAKTDSETPEAVPSP